MGLISRISDPYGSLEAWTYDTFLAPAVKRIVDAGGPAPWVALPARPSILDVGCGGGQLAVRIARERPDAQVSGIDLSAGQIARATRRARKARVAVDFRVGDATRLPFIGARFGLVVSIGSIKHWPDRRAGVAEAVRVLAPGGRLWIMEFDSACTPDEAERFMAAWRPPRLLRRRIARRFMERVTAPSIGRDEVRALLGSQPLAAVSVERVPGYPVLGISATRL